MKKYLAFPFLSLLFGLTLLIGHVNSAQAQIPGAILSAGALGGVQSSSVAGISGGTYGALRGSFSNFFAEARIASWGDNTSYIHETGFLGGTDMSIWHIMVSGAVGLGSSTYQPGPLSGQPIPSVNYTSFLYEAQAIYQFDIIKGMVTAGAGVNYIGESNIGSASGIPAINGWGPVAMVSIGL
ncbi:MAG: hypothetical protein Q8922_09510 [Bacteroidota bacterium]|nr:hypothetical protein [Bacteroidota bacterium]MDP4234429.1 hypothetical protein [Bacteroidota bacterium]MDP4243995.1 hypothetical protein [Bacteroidota bacterium]MDP4288161.1 hypothetical protein [Bacteroidota bacterium]